MFKLSMYDLPN